MTEPGLLNEHEARAWYAFVGAAVSLDRRLDQQLKEDSGITHLQYVVLVRLDSAPDREMRMGALAETLHTTKSGLTYQIAQLEKAGLVRRRGCSGDPRAVYAVLTDDGRRMLEQAAPGHIATVREVFLEAFTPEQLAVLADGLNEVARRARGEGAPSVTR
ncbi:MarR family transcriptional regulator [Streptomyces sp. NPDC005648]|uniref:MarR family winged helix-turn-helix transcriptional regulator n=1 Tax=Streptomyces sp. NPDC005648 TaxID=3157044 RepID=UPI0033A11CD7